MAIYNNLGQLVKPKDKPIDKQSTEFATGWLREAVTTYGQLVGWNQYEINDYLAGPIYTIDVNSIKVTPVPPENYNTPPIAQSQPRIVK